MEERYYVLDRFAEVSRTLCSLIENLPLKRKAVQRYQDKGELMKAKETYVDLEAAKDKLLITVQSAKLLFLETDMADCADFAAGCMTPYARLIC